MKRVPLISLLRECKRRGICFGPDERPKVYIYYWLYDGGKRGTQKGGDWHYVDRIDMPNIRYFVDAEVGSFGWEKISDPRFAEVIVKTSNGKELYFRRKYYRWNDIKPVPTNPNWTNGLAKPGRPMTEYEKQTFREMVTR